MLSGEVCILPRVTEQQGFPMWSIIY